MTPAPDAVVRIEGSELARVVGNAIPFLPARSRFKRARLHFDRRDLEVLVTDGYTAANDVGEAEPDLSRSLYVEVDLEGLKALDKAGRDGKKGYALIEVFIGDCVRITDIEGVTTAIPCYEPDQGFWTRVEELFDFWGDQPPTLPQTICLDPSLLMRFSKVKTDKSERMADFLISDAERPVLVRIGATFTALIMPIDRTVHAANVGEDGLWDSEPALQS